MNTESSVFYHDDDPHDPLVNDEQRILSEDHWWPCPACGHSDRLEPGCRCECHSTRRHA